MYCKFPTRPAFVRSSHISPKMAVFLYEPSLKAVMVQVREFEDLREWDLPAWLREKSVPDALPEVYLALIPRHLTAILQPGDTHIFRQMKQRLHEIMHPA